MRIQFLWVAAVSLAVTAGAAERSFQFSSYTPDRTPQGFRSTVAGEGKPGDWRVVEDELPSAMQKISENAPVTSRRRVVGQLSQDPTDERFPILYFEGDTYGDFDMTTRFKLVDGALEQMAGVVFRMQDERNFYVIRASGLGNNLRFYKMVGGVRSAPIGPEIPIAKGVWHTLRIECKGNRIHAWLNGKEAIPQLTDNTFTAGRIGFWTKSDAISYFGDTDLEYKPKEPFAQTMVRDMMKQQPRLHGIRVFVPDAATGALKVVASNDEKFLGQAGSPIEDKAFKTDAIFQARNSGTVTVVMPLHDRNGDTVAVVHLLMESFLGQTEQNVLARALPIVKAMQLRINAAKDLTD